MKSNPKKVVVIGALPGHKKRVRGKYDHEAWRANQFPKGKSGNPGGKPRVHLKFKAKIAEKMLEPAPPEVRQALKLRKGATIYDAMIAALLTNAMDGDNAAFMHAHDIVDGPIVQKHFNLTASMEKFLSDPGFRNFLQQAHGEYLQQIGVTDNGTGSGIPASSPLSRIRGAADSEDE